MTKFWKIHDPSTDAHIFLIWWGIMSATLWIFLKELEEHVHIHIFERREAVWYESSDALNNAGTWHSALCELNYTPYKNWNIDTSKADAIMEKFEISKQFWSYLVWSKYLPHWNSFINHVPHMSIVFWEENRQFLRDRFEALKENQLFEDMIYTTEHTLLRKRFPLIMQDRNNDEIITATRSELWTDVNYWNLTRDMYDYLNTDERVHIHLHQEIVDLNQTPDWHWEVSIKDISWAGNNLRKMRAEFVFIWSWGTSIPLLAKSWVTEWCCYSGFPVDGQWLICSNPDVINQHHGKVYGLAEVWSPPMSVPHIDTRVINWKKTLLFWPYAWFTTKFLKHWSWTDLFTSLRWNNIIPLLTTWVKYRSLTKYLIWQVFQSKEQRFAALRKYYPNARYEDWHREHAWKRVQIIKKKSFLEGELQFWTEVVVSQDKTLAALLWASPWASTSVSIILELLESAFPQKMASKKRQDIIKHMIPSYWVTLKENPTLAKQVRNSVHDTLDIHPGSFEKITWTFE